jgi:hypothetical protein
MDLNATFIKTGAIVGHNGTHYASIYSWDCLPPGYNNWKGPFFI